MDVMAIKKWFLALLVTVSTFAVAQTSVNIPAQTVSIPAQTVNLPAQVVSLPAFPFNWPAGISYDGVTLTVPKVATQQLTLTNGVKYGAGNYLASFDGLGNVTYVAVPVGSGFIAQNCSTAGVCTLAIVPFPGSCPPGSLGWNGHSWPCLSAAELPVQATTVEGAN
jgi:hypothetical protein